MKKLILASAFLLLALTTNAQDSDNDNQWFASIGLNAINSNGAQSPINNPGDWAKSLPLSLAVELSWTENLAIEQAFTMNVFAEGDKIDGAILTEDFTYTSFDTHVKYYFGKHILPKVDWIDFYGNAGVGFFHINNTNISANIGGGVLFWLNRRKTFGIRAQTIAKFALDSKDSGLETNHFQTHLQLIFAL